ncbi:MAG: penicillin-binding transpeptidase domain-containing protein [Chloroflexota bacterium]|nr:penicillin-binding transpeptidase domain-containing protein [Chloroflexota bacterium]MDE2896257.1 penicillin-binding transpeptidase domain-containing protein [Chloroflexota bacterium]
MGDVPRLQHLSLRIWVLAPVFAVLALSACVFGGESERDLSQYFPPPPQEGEAPTQDQATSAGAAVGGTTDQSGAYTPPAEELEYLEVAPASARFAVQSFFHLVATGDLRSAYQRTSTETRERITVEAFEQRYRDVWAEATIRGFTWEVTPQEDENASSHEVVIRYQTTFFGEIEEIIQARALRQPHWVVDWTPDLMFSGLGSPGYLINALIETPPRGQILDRNGVVLAGETDVTIVGVHWDSISDEEAVLRFFVDRLNMAEEDVRALIYQDLPSYQFIPVAVLPIDTPPESIGEFERLASDGILLTHQTRRFYPFGSVAAHVIGYLQEINPTELAEWFVEGYRAGDMVGRDGIEQSFERALAGRRGGTLLVVDPIGRPVREITTRAAIPGADIRLTLDIRVQELAEAALGEEPGAVVAIDPRSGHVLAMASFPRIDPNTIVDGVTQEEYETYFFDERQPFINRALEQVYAPGSTFKIVTLAAALEGGGYEITDRIDCPAHWMEVGDQPLRNWKDENQGRITLSQALAESCNTVFYELGLHLDRIDDQLLPSVASGFGFGQATGIIGLNEESGVNPGPSWKEEQVNEAWFTGDTLNLSIGQGFLAVTVLQLANAYAALATNGVVSTPIIAQSIEPHGRPPEVIDRRSISVLPVSADTLEQLQAALRTTVSQPYGTGFYVFRGSVLRIAGKSGTAEDQVVEPDALADIDDEETNELNDDEQIDVELNSEQTQDEEADEQGAQQEEEPERYFTHAWFSAWANFEEPRLVVTVVLDDGKSGSDDAGPIVQRILEGTILNNWVP